MTHHNGTRKGQVTGTCGMVWGLSMDVDAMEGACVRGRDEADSDQLTMAD